MEPGTILTVIKTIGDLAWKFVTGRQRRRREALKLELEGLMRQAFAETGSFGLLFPPEWFAKRSGASLADIRTALGEITREGRIFFEPTVGQYSLRPLGLAAANIY